MKELKKNWPYLLFGLVALLFLIVKESQSSTPRGTVESIDLQTFIPKGFVLVPLQLKNSQKLDSILGSHAIVSLYKSKDNITHLVGQNIRILRSPKNPKLFAVLSPQDKAKNFLDPLADYSVALQGPQKSGTKIENQKQQRIIQYEDW